MVVVDVGELAMEEQKQDTVGSSVYGLVAIGSGRSLDSLFASRFGNAVFGSSFDFYRGRCMIMEQ